jgi:prepilin-type N-terminal cleavage/methylation domain-containing protein
MMRHRPGFSLIEVLLSVSVFSLLVVAFIGTLLYGQESLVLSGTRNRATVLAEEGLEAGRNMRDDNYTNLFNGTHGLTTAGNIWSFSGTEDITDIYTRKISIAQVDADRKQVTSQVTWQQNGQRTGTVSLVTYLTHWVQGAGPTPTPPPGWANPIFQASIDASGAQDGLKIQVQGNYAYLIRAGGTPDFLIIDVTNPASPSVTGTLSLTGNPNNIYVSGNYAYIASDATNEELQIVNISNPASPVVVGTFNATGGAQGFGVWVVGTTAYLTRAASVNDELIIINVSNPASPTLLGSLDLGSGGTGNEIVVLGSQAYIASSSITELFVVNVSNPAAPTLTTAFDAPGASAALTIAGFGSTVLLGRGDNNLNVINVSNPATPSMTGTINVGGNVNDIALGYSNTLAFLATADGSKEFQIVDISNPSLPSIYGTLNITGTGQLRGIAFDQTLDRAFGASSFDTTEFNIFRPGP